VKFIRYKDSDEKKETWVNFEKVIAIQKLIDSKGLVIKLTIEGNNTFTVHITDKTFDSLSIEQFLKACTKTI
jgi:outer membrane lipoprotein-sorting protein